MSVNKDANNNTVFSPFYSAIDDSGRFLGDSFTASGMATTIHDFEITNDMRIKGAHFFVTNATFGDTADFSIVDKDDVLGLFQYYGLEPGDVLELKRYVQHIPFPGSDCCDMFQDKYEVDNPGFACSGLYMRCVYDNVGSGDANVGIVYQVYVET